MIIEIAPFDLVDGNRYIPADVVGRIYREALDTVEMPGAVDVDVVGRADDSVHLVLRDPVGGPPQRNTYGEVMRAIVVVRLGRGSVSLDNARLMFALKDVVVSRIDAIDPPIGEWYPLPAKETAA